MYRIALALTLALLSLDAVAKEYMGQKVIEVPFKIAGGATVTLPITVAGPIPAEDRKVRIEGAGPSIDAGQPEGAVLAWNFAFTNKGMKDIARVEVAEVSPSDPEVLLVSDTAPTLHEKLWTGSTKPIAVTEGAASWLFSERASFFVFRFTITERGKSPRVLYQMAYFPAEAKAQLRKIADRRKAD